MKQKEKPVLSIALLVSNRWDTIQKCLDSLTPIRKAIPSELLILDTGCDPELHDLLVSYADKIECFEWCRDFAKARNVTVDMAEGEWYLYLDDDEWFTETEELIEFFKSGDYKNYGHADYIQRNYLDEQGYQYTDCWVGRIIKLEEDTRFRSKIHEYLVPIRGKGKSLRAIVDHYGYVYKDEEAKQKHFQRNYVLLKEMLEEEPREIRWKLQLVQELRTVDKHQEMIDCGIAYMKDVEASYNIVPGEDYGENHAIGVFYAAILLGYSGQKNYKKVAEWCDKVRKDPRINELAKAFGELMAANAYFYMEKYEECIEACKNYLAYDEYFKTHQKELYSFQRSPFVSTTYDIVKYKEVYSLLICSGLKRNDLSYLGAYMDKLEWDIKNVYLFEEIGDVVVESICRIGYKEEFYRLMKLIRNHSALRNYFEEKIKEWKEKGTDTTPIETLEEWGDRQAGKKQLQEIAEALTKVNAMIKTLLSIGNKTELAGILAEAQKVAVSLGTAIEEDFGLGTRAVGYLEEYCEVLWTIHEASCGEERTKEEQMANVDYLAELIKNVKWEIFIA